MNSKTIQALGNRTDLAVIAEHITHSARVLDLGCGKGELLRYLKDSKGVTCSGMELSQESILNCVKIGVPVIQADLNDGLGEFPDKSFDFVILSQTLQAVDRPDKLLVDIVRVGRKAILSFINFAHYDCRLQLMFRGRMPITKMLPDNWFDTRNIHLATLNDFRTLCKSTKINIIEEFPLGVNFGFMMRLWPNLFAQTCVFVICKEPSA